MKVSDKIKGIIADATERFDCTVSSHNNDTFQVCIFFQTKVAEEDGPEWWVHLSKPSQRQLDTQGEHFDEAGCKSIRLSEEETRFIVKAPTLMQALNELHERVLNEGWDD